MANEEVWSRKIGAHTYSFGFGVDDDERVCLDVTDLHDLLVHSGFHQEP